MNKLRIVLFAIMFNVVLGLTFGTSEMLTDREATANIIMEAQDARITQITNAEDQLLANTYVQGRSAASYGDTTAEAILNLPGTIAYGWNVFAQSYIDVSKIGSLRGNVGFAEGIILFFLQIATVVINAGMFLNLWSIWKSGSLD